MTPVDLAKSAIENYLQNGIEIKSPDGFGQDLPARAGVFVSLHLKSTGELRGCVGTISPSEDSIGEEIIQNAIFAAKDDNRFEPVVASIVPDLDINVDILSEPIKIEKTDKIDPAKYGLIVATRDGRRGLLLPDIEGVETAEDQIKICRQKGGIGEAEEIEYYLFTVTRYKE